MSSEGNVQERRSSGIGTVATQPNTLTSYQLKSRLYATPEVLKDSRPQYKVLHGRSRPSNEVH